jgi:hypothetical protein
VPETEQLAATVAETVKVAVLVVNATAGVEVSPNARNPRTATGSADLIAFENFMVMTPRTAHVEN